MDVITRIKNLGPIKVDWEKITAEDLDLDYCILFSKDLADDIFDNLEKTIKYYEDELTKIKCFGKVHNIPRQQVAYGDPGVTYKFSGLVLPAMRWTNTLRSIRDLLQERTGFKFNFVLINRYRNGVDHMGEHRDNEPELDQNAPIISISFGQHRDFILKHGDVRKKISAIPLVKKELEHGSILFMNPPTNKFWYHSLPIRRKSNGVRINLTFRKILM